MIINYTATCKDSSNTLKDILKNKLFISNILLKKLKYTNSIFLNERSVYLNYPVKENDIIKIDFDNMNNIIFNDKTNVYYKPKFLDKYEKFNLKLDILYEDEYLLIMNKPYNMPIHPSCDNYTNTLSNAVATYLEKQNIYAVHIITRLDKNTSGICIFAKNEYIQELFIRNKEKINLKKEYIAIADGIISKKSDIITKKIARKTNSIIVREINENGDYAKTEYSLLKVNINSNYSVVKVFLHTGRTHQIRVHFASIGHVLLGDNLYAKEYNVKNITKYINRQALHAYKISFNHPIIGRYIKICAPLPEDMEKLI